MRPLSAEKSELKILSGVRMPVPGLCLRRTIWMLAGLSSRCTAAQRVLGVALLRVLRRDTKSSMLETLVLLAAPMASS